MSLREQGSAHGGGKDERKGRNDELYYKLKNKYLKMIPMFLFVLQKKIKVLLIIIH